MTTFMLAAVTYLTILYLYSIPVSGHGLMTDPPQRGTLNPRSRLSPNGKDPNAPIDDKAHFPAGEKSSAAGAALRSQKAAMGSRLWTPFAPAKSSFRWRAGVCGDPIGQKPGEHTRGGRFYFGGKVTRVYKEGATISSTANIIAHHNGFIELRVCDVSKCGGEISERCFKQGHCSQLMRAPQRSCDSGMDKDCAPIDRANPGRWYLPCSTVAENTAEFMGGKKMLYNLPKGLVCEHCVLHWFWTAANSCNPPGVVEFFEGRFGPKNWGTCPGQAGAKGGYTSVQRPCGSAPDKFPEEYYQCADITIESAGKGREEEKDSDEERAKSKDDDSEKNRKRGGRGSGKANGIKQLVEEKSATSTDNSWNGVFTKLLLIADDKVIGPLSDGLVVDIGKYSRVTIEAETSRKDVKYVQFFVDGKHIWTERGHPYGLYGNKGKKKMYWRRPVVGKFFVMKAEAGNGDFIERKIMFVRN